MVLYEKVFKTEDGTAITATVNMKREEVEFKCFGKRHRRWLRFAGDRIGFITVIPTTAPKENKKPLL